MATQSCLAFMCELSHVVMMQKGFWDDDWLAGQLHRRGDVHPSSDFDLNRDAWPKGRVRLRPAGVLLPLIRKEGQLYLILTKRASDLRHHPGQVAFPGGKVDDGDADVTDAALREATEEIGLPRHNVKVLGALPCHETVTSFAMHPIVAMVQRPFEIRPEAGEVEEVFEVPFAHVTEPSNFLVHGRMWFGQERRYYAVPYGPYYIWGATARILRNFAELLRGAHAL